MVTITPATKGRMSIRALNFRGTILETAQSMTWMCGFKNGSAWVETTKLIFSGEIFNILNRTNMQLAQSTSTGSPTLYCRSALFPGIEQPGQTQGPALARCGLKRRD